MCSFLWELFLFLPQKEVNHSEASGPGTLRLSQGIFSTLGFGLPRIESPGEFKTFNRGWFYVKKKKKNGGLLYNVGVVWAHGKAANAQRGPMALGALAEVCVKMPSLAVDFPWLDQCLYLPWVLPRKPAFPLLFLLCCGIPSQFVLKALNLKVRIAPPRGCNWDTHKVNLTPLSALCSVSFLNS